MHLGVGWKISIYPSVKLKVRCIYLGLMHVMVKGKSNVTWICHHTLQKARWFWEIFMSVRHSCLHSLSMTPKLLWEQNSDNIGNQKKKEEEGSHRGGPDLGWRFDMRAKTTTSERDGNKGIKSNIFFLPAIGASLAWLLIICEGFEFHSS